MPGGDEIRDVQRAAWAGLSASWEKWDPVIMDQLGPVGAAMIERLGIAGDQRARLARGRLIIAGPQRLGRLSVHGHLAAGGIGDKSGAEQLASRPRAGLDSG